MRCGFADQFAGLVDAQLGIFDDGADLRETFLPQAGNRYFLVVASTAASEGSFGVDSSGGERPAGLTACRAEQSTAPCP